MPRYIAPHKSGAHRVAGIALFRALLSKCRLAKVDDSTKRTSQNVVRNSFRRNRHTTGKILLQKLFNGGYEALELLQASAAGHDESSSRICSLLASIPGYLTKPPPQAAPKDRKSATKGPPLNPDSSHVLSRPRPTVAGKRRIPILVSANNYPMLRFKKPQADHLGAYFKKKTMKRQRRHDQKEALIEQEPIGSWEDEWDRLIAQAAKQEEVDIAGLTEEQQAGSWAWGFQYSVWYLRDRLRQEWEKSMQLTRQYEEVIRKEKALAEKEEQAAKHDNTVEKL